MKVEEVIATVATFFNDLIGAWVPGAVLAVGLAIMHLGLTKIEGLLAKIGNETGVMLIFAGLLFALGHTLSAVHKHALKCSWRLWKVFLTKNCEVSMAKKRESRESFKCFASMMEETLGKCDPPSWSYNDLRSVALSISPEAASLGRRFMFISLLCNGVGTALVIMGVDSLVCHFIWPELLHSYEQAAPLLVQLLLLFGTAYCLFKHGKTFHGRAMATPFPIAIAELKFRKKQNDSPT